MNGQYEETLTPTQLERQDFVDNTIYDTLNALGIIPLEWDIEAIARVRDAIEAYAVESGIMSKQEFYPSLPTEISS